MITAIEVMDRLPVADRIITGVIVGFHITGFETGFEFGAIFQGKCIVQFAAVNSNILRQRSYQRIRCAQQVAGIIIIRTDQRLVAGRFIADIVEISGQLLAC